ncbi:MAG TPA: aminopeptidase P family N-terminal domain-containing protein [Aestuariivirgaceae bacterium]|nr:aminopeptidase P family N-terminal domain-containing protein [Aestuariivirgaceae bacterium]
MDQPVSRPRLVDYRDNGKKLQAAFSAAEMQRRQDAIRGYLAENIIDAALFTSYHNICYLSGFLYCSFGRRYGFLVDSEKATTISSAIDGGQPWRRGANDNIAYTDWQRDNFFHAIRALTKGIRRLAIEFDHL